MIVFLSQNLQYVGIPSLAPNQAMAIQDTINRIEYHEDILGICVTCMQINLYPGIAFSYILLLLVSSQLIIYISQYVFISEAFELFDLGNRSVETVLWQAILFYVLFSYVMKVIYLPASHVCGKEQVRLSMHSERQKVLYIYKAVLLTQW